MPAFCWMATAADCLGTKRDCPPEWTTPDHFTVFYLGAFRRSIMSGIVPNQSKNDFLQAVISGTAMNGWKLRLFANNATISATTVLADLTEATFTGYAAVTTATWPAPALDGSNRGSSLNTQGQFTPTAGGGSGNIYGWYLTNSGGTVLYAVEKFASSPITVAQSVVLEVDITALLDSLF